MADRGDTDGGGADAATGQEREEAVTAFGSLAAGQANAGLSLVKPIPAQTFRVHEAGEVRLPAVTVH